MGATKELENQLKMEIFEEHVHNKIYFQNIVNAKFKVSMFQKNLTEESYIFKKHFGKEFFSVEPTLETNNFSTSPFDFDRKHLLLG